MARAISRARRRLAVLALLLSGLAFAGLAPAHAAGTASISGTVTAPAGVDVTQTTVSLLVVNPSGGAMLDSETHPDATGAYHFDGRGAGQYKIQFENPSASTVWNSGASTQDSAPSIVLAQGQSLTGQNVSLARAGSISGTVVVPASGTSVGSVKVEAYSAASGDHVVAQTTPGADGTYTLSGLLPGTYKLKFTYGVQPDPPVWNGDAATRAAAPGIVLADGAAVAGQDASFVYTGSISGVAKTPEGAVLTHRGVLLLTAAGAFVGDTALDAQGRYSFTGLAAGQYKVALKSALPGMSADWYQHGTDEASATVITVAKNKAVTGIDFVAPAQYNGTISGRVSGYTGRAPAMIMVFPANDPHPGSGQPLGVGEVHPDGGYVVFGLPTGKVKAIFIGEVDGYANQWFGGGSQATSRDISVVEGRLTRGINFTAVPEAIITGTVKKPFDVSRTYIRVLDLQGNDVDYAFTNEDGSYSVHGLPAGSYKIQFDNLTGGRVTAWYGGTTFETAAVVTVAAGQTVTGIDSNVIIGGAKPAPKPTTGQPKPTAPPVVVQPAGSTSGGELAATGTPDALQPLGLAGGALAGIGLLLLLAARFRIRR